MAVIFVGPMYFLILKLLFYRVRGLQEMRRQFAREREKHSGSWIICANHLTMIDSFILTYATMSLGNHIIDFRKLPWNLPERKNFQSNIILAVLSYLSKCIPIDRGGSRDKIKNTMDKCIYLLRDGQTVMIFPEGGRSRTGRVNVDNFSYGVGRFIKDVENCRIMCIYLRGDRQHQYSNIPAWGDKFSVQMEVFNPDRVPDGGLRAQREYAAQIIKKLAKMEENYFATHGERCSGFAGSGQCGEKRGFPVSSENPHKC